MSTRIITMAIFLFRIVQPSLAQPDLVCDPPSPPTIVISAPGLTGSCGGESAYFEIYNATPLKRVSFTILDKNVGSLSNFQLANADPLLYSLQATPVGDSVSYQVVAHGLSFGQGRLNLEWIWPGCSCGTYPQCNEAGMPVKLGVVSAIDSLGTEYPTLAVDGGFHSHFDGGVTVLRGRVFYSDGVTSVGLNGLVSLFSIDGIRLDERFNESETSSNGIYVAAYPGADVGFTAPPRIVIARACLGDGCTGCTAYEEIAWGGLDDPARYDFILPVDPPPPAATPTPTVTATSTPTATPRATGTPTYATDINREVGIVSVLPMPRI